MLRTGSHYRKVCLAAAVTAAGAASPLFGQTVATWVGPTGGVWTDATRWSINPYYPNNGTPGGATYDARVLATGSAYAVGLSSDVTVQAFTLNSADATLLQSGGTLSAGTVSLLAGTYNATGGSLVATTVNGTPGMGINVAGNYLLNVGTLGANVNVGTGSWLTMAGSWSNSGAIAVNGGTLTWASAPASVGSVSLTNSTLEVGAIVTTAQVLTPTFSNSTVRIASGGGVNNLGNTISLTPAGPAWQLAGGIIGYGSITSSGGVKLGLQPGTTSTLSTVSLGADVDVPSGTTLTLTNLAANTGTISVNGGTLNLYYDSTAALGTIHNVGGTVQITGTLNNGGATLALNAATGPWQLQGVDPNGPGPIIRSAISNGTITGTAPYNLVAVGATVLAGVTLAGEVTIGNGTATNTSLSVSTPTLAPGARLTLNAPAGTATTTELMVAGSQTTLDGSATIVFDGAGDGGVVRAESSGMTFGPALSVRTGVRGGTVGTAGTTLVNKGLLSAQTAGRTLAVAGTFTNKGTVEARNGGTVSIGTTPTSLAGGILTEGTWNVYGGSTLSMPGSVTTNAASVTLSGPGSTFAAMNSLASNTGSLTVTGGRTFTTGGNLSNAGTTTVGSGSTLKVNGTLTNAGKVDLAGGALVLDYTGASPADWLRGQLAAGRAGGTWAGTTGVTSSVAAADAQKRIGVGYAEASQLGVTSWGGVSVDSTAVVTKLTYYGDANLDGKIDADDYALIDLGFSQHRTGWVYGDFDYSGVVDAADYLLMDRVYIQQGGALSPDMLAQRESEFGTAYAAQLAMVVPEPSAAVLLAGVPLLMRRRRRD